MDFITLRLGLIFIIVGFFFLMRERNDFKKVSKRKSLKSYIWENLYWIGLSIIIIFSGILLTVAGFFR